MIYQPEIKAKAIEFDILPLNVERDYVFRRLLKSIYENGYLLARLVFNGGNCLRKAFYPDTRFSADLGFSVGDAIDAERMGEEINRASLNQEANVRFQALDADRRNAGLRAHFRTAANGPVSDRRLLDLKLKKRTLAIAVLQEALRPPITNCRNDRKYAPRHVSKGAIQSRSQPTRPSQKLQPFHMLSSMSPLLPSLHQLQIPIVSVSSRQAVQTY